MTLNGYGNDFLDDDYGSCVINTSSLQVHSSTSSAINGTSVVAPKEYGNIFATDLKPKAAMDIADRVIRAQTTEGRTALVRNALIERRDLRAHLVAIFHSSDDRELKAFSLKLHAAMPKTDPENA